MCGAWSSEVKSQINSLGAWSEDAKIGRSVERWRPPNGPPSPILNSIHGLRDDGKGGMLFTSNNLQNQG